MDNLNMVSDGSKEDIFRNFAGNVSAFGLWIALKIFFNRPVNVDELLAAKEIRYKEVGQ